MYPIRKGFPMPADGREIGTARKYDFSGMEVGDCMITPIGKYNAVASAAREWARRIQPEWRFAARKINDTEGGVWRVK